MAQMMDKAKEFFAEKIADVRKPEADLTDVTVKHVSRDAVNFVGHLSVRNPYGHAVPICEISYTLKSNGRVIASGTMPDPGSIAAKDTTKMEIPLAVPYGALMSIMRDVGRDWDLDYELQVGFTVDLPVIGNFTLPLTKRGEVKLPTLSEMF